MPSIRRRIRRRRIERSFGLQLTSLMDALMIIVVFLLKSYGISAMGVQHTDNLELPYSIMKEAYGEGFVLIIAKDKIYFDNKEILQFTNPPEEKLFLLPEGTSGSDNRILPLYDALIEKKSSHELLASRSENAAENIKKWKGDLLIQSDKSVPYQLLRKVMYTAGVAGYKRFRLTVAKVTK